MGRLVNRWRWAWWSVAGGGPGDRVEVVVDRTLLGQRVVAGVPDVDTGRDTTYAQMRRMALDVERNSWRTPVEKGLAVSLLAVIADLEKVLVELDRVGLEPSSLPRVEG